MSKSKSRLGLVLEGGAMRATYTIGVLDVLMENNIAFDGVIGVSAGAIHGASLVSGQNGRNIRYYKKYGTDKRFMSVHSLITTGDLVGKDFCYSEIPERLDPFDFDTFKNSPIEFYVVVTNVETGKAEYIRLTDLSERDQMEYLRASASMPIVSKIISIKKRPNSMAQQEEDTENTQDTQLSERSGEYGLYLDGGVTDSIPLKAMRSMGFERNVVVATRTDGYVKKSERVSVASLLYRKYPAFVRAMRERPDKYNEQKKYVLEHEREGSIFFIRPREELDIARTDTNPEHLEQVYQVGRHDAENALEPLRIWLGG